ncbi:MAG: tetratricopeptide repeat protein [Alteromonadaceae bacterium]|nr:tetratricopeptide repeat protein [Alteromonadaceae bacterium]
MQALQQTGPVDAKKYFQASLLLEESNHWARAYLARSLYSLGEWQNAEQVFNAIPTEITTTDVSLGAFIQYWRSELAYRRGDNDVNEQINSAIKKAEATTDTKLMALSYRLKAKIAWQQMDWPAHQTWSTKA